MKHVKMGMYSSRDTSGASLHCNYETLDGEEMSKFEVLDHKYRELLVEANTLLTIADSVGISPSDELCDEVRKGISSVANDVTPFFEILQAVIYPMVAEIYGSLNSTDTMNLDIIEIRHLTSELEAMLNSIERTQKINVFEANRLRSILYGLHTVLSLHISKEKEVFLPLLEKRLSDVEVQSLHARLHEAMEIVP